jgi:hypothetical protein
LEAFAHQEPQAFEASQVECTLGQEEPALRAIRQRHAYGTTPPRGRKVYVAMNKKFWGDLSNACLHQMRSTLIRRLKKARDHDAAYVSAWITLDYVDAEVKRRATLGMWP